MWFTEGWRKPIENKLKTKVSVSGLIIMGIYKLNNIKLPNIASLGYKTGALVQSLATIAAEKNNPFLCRTVLLSSKPDFFVSMGAGNKGNAFLSSMSSGNVYQLFQGQ